VHDWKYAEGYWKTEKCSSQRRKGAKKSLETRQRFAPLREKFCRLSAFEISERLRRYDSDGYKS
jgi:hypothetical protein